VPATHPQLFRPDKSNTHLATLKEIDNRIWSPTTAYELHARVVLNQDMANAQEVTAGMHSPSFDGHRLSEEQEVTIYNHHRVADRFLWAG
jgi:hypothetical protein